MMQQAVTDKDREMAQKCVECPVCTSARDKQRGLALACTIPRCLAARPGR
jgi:hypothetical protein